MIFVGGDHPRHIYVASELHSAFGLDEMIIQRREPMVSRAGYSTALEERHFMSRWEHEQMAFGHAHHPNVPIQEVDDVNDVEIPKSDTIVVFGCGIIKQDIEAINMHLGLSPRYRGAATLFWPFYFLEPQWAGVTLHKITPDPDAGPILHQCRPPLYHGDGIHAVATRAVVEACRDLIELLQRDVWFEREQKSSGKLFLQSDFRPEHLRLVYELCDNKIVDMYLDGDLGDREPKLHDGLSCG